MIHWESFLFAAAIVAATPGANQLLALKNGAVVGVGRAVRASGGRFAAFALMVVAVSVGVGGLLARSQVTFEVLRWVGVAYLVWLGISSWRNSGAGSHDLASELSTAARSRQEFLVAMANPKALILFTVFLPQFVTGGTGGSVPALLTVGAVYIVIEFAAACGYAVAGAVIARGGLTAQARKIMDRVTGTAMIGLAGALAVDRR